MTKPKYPYLRGPLDYTPFIGDGRASVEPTMGVLPGTVPIAVRRKTCRMFIERLVTVGSSTHSGRGSTLWVLLAWVQRHKLPYMLYASPGESYTLQLVTMSEPAP